MDSAMHLDNSKPWSSSSADDLAYSISAVWLEGARLHKTVECHRNTGETVFFFAVARLTEALNAYGATVWIVSYNPGLVAVENLMNTFYQLNNDLPQDEDDQITAIVKVLTECNFELPLCASYFEMLPHGKASLDALFPQKKNLTLIFETLYHANWSATREFKPS